MAEGSSARRHSGLSMSMAKTDSLDPSEDRVTFIVFDPERPDKDLVRSHILDELHWTGISLSMQTGCTAGAGEKLEIPCAPGTRSRLSTDYAIYRVRAWVAQIPSS